jgi:hypothetical protein
METISSYAQDIMTVLGALYTIAVVIVKLTPTPTDDTKLGEVSVFIKGLCKVFGLDIKQGVNTKS